MNIDKHELLRRYLDGELNDSEESEALSLIAGDPALRSMLRFDMNLRQNLSAPASRVPEGFTDRVMTAIHASVPENKHAHTVEATRDVSGASEDRLVDEVSDPAGWPGWWARLSGFFEPRQVQWSPAWSAGLAIGMLLLVFLSVYTTGLIMRSGETGDLAALVTQVADESTDRVLMRFVYVDRDAESVSVAGDFSDWEPISLTRVSINGDQAWTGLIPLTRGEHRYMFIKDGEEWVTDPFAKTFRDDGFGNRNAVISL
jgi:hypothetical protein